MLNRDFSFVADGTTITVRFNHRARLVLEQRHKLTIDAILGGALRDSANLEAMLLVGIRAYQRGLPDEQCVIPHAMAEPDALEKVRDFIDAAGRNDAFEACDKGYAMGLASPSAVEEIRHLPPSAAPKGSPEGKAPPTGA